MSRNAVDLNGCSLRLLPAFIGVVIPARDEEDAIAIAVSAVRRAFEHPALQRTEARIAVVDDSSSDTTGDRAAAVLGKQGDVVRVEVGSAGAAREAGFQHLCAGVGGVDREQAWFAMTDADSIVSADWLIRQLRWWRRGADAVAGRVRPTSWEEQPPVVRRRYQALMAQRGEGLGHSHVYGANLGLTMSSYVAAGGIPTMSTGEDHALLDGVRHSGGNVVHVDDVVVATSTRREARASGGFADLLRSLSGTP
jgi:glycosyltransferase involved in cell wall biosynthesis